MRQAKKGGYIHPICLFDMSGSRILPHQDTGPDEIGRLSPMIANSQEKNVFRIFLGVSAGKTEKLNSLLSLSTKYSS
jgi:hypothetical protein